MPGHSLPAFPFLVMHLQFMVGLVDGTVSPVHSKRTFLLDSILSLVGKGAEVNPTAPQFYILLGNC